jgi:multicomponent Na+:H+ antiporter subunit E
VLVPVSESETVRNTVAHVVRAVAEGDHADARPAVHFVSPVSWQRRRLDADAHQKAQDLLDRVETWVDEDLGVEGERPIAVTTAVVGAEDLLFSPRDYATVLVDYAREHDLEHIVLDPEYRPGTRAPLLADLDAELDYTVGLTHEQAPVQRQVRRARLRQRAVDLNIFGATFVLSFLFYQVVGGFAGTFDYVTGAISAGIVAAVLSGITFERAIRPRRTLKTGARMLLYVPYLFWEIARANIEVAYIILHPSLPIDPSMAQFSPALPPGLPATTLANSITLTPGTVTVDVRGRDFYIHSLTKSSEEALYDGALERAVRFVFFGRAGARIPPPRQRHRTQSVDSDAETDERGDRSAAGEADDTDTDDGEEGSA